MNALVLFQRWAGEMNTVEAWRWDWVPNFSIVPASRLVGLLSADAWLTQVVMTS